MWRVCLTFLDLAPAAGERVEEDDVSAGREEALHPAEALQKAPDFDAWWDIHEAHPLSGRSEMPLLFQEIFKETIIFITMIVQLYYSVWICKLFILSEGLHNTEYYRYASNICICILRLKWNNTVISRDSYLC